MLLEKYQLNASGEERLYKNSEQKNFWVEKSFTPDKFPFIAMI